MKEFACLQSRMGLIQTAQQLRFCWKTIVDWIHMSEESPQERGNGDSKSEANGASSSSSNQRKRLCSDHSSKAMEQQQRFGGETESSDILQV